MMGEVGRTRHEAPGAAAGRSEGMYSTALTRQSREEALRVMCDPTGVDLLVVGGGVTGAGIALDAATRGLRVAIVEARDWAGGTSQSSSKLVHGGLRYLYNLDVPLVAEALRERGVLLDRTAPHLVSPQPFLWPLTTKVVERAYSAVGVGMYDVLAQLGGLGRPGVPVQKHYTREGARELFPGIKDDALVGAIRFYDARVDDARLVLALVRTAAGFGALAASRTEVVGFERAPTGRVIGAQLRDLEGDRELHVRCRYVLSATGVWTERTQDLVRDDAGLRVLASKGIHIVVPREAVDGDIGLFLRTERSVLFVIPWERYWIIGTTDTAWTQDLERPVATAADIDYILQHANSVLARPLTHDDIIGTYAGLRPLLQPKTKGGGDPAKVSREHTVASIAPGMSAIAGGKLTTYRVMASDAVDVAVADLDGPAEPDRPCLTEDIELVGAGAYRGLLAQRRDLARRTGWSPERVERLLHRYGDEVRILMDMVGDTPALGEPLVHAPDYLRVEAAFAVTHEGALHLEDILTRRIRLDFEVRDRGVSAAGEIADVVAPLLDWDEDARARELDAYRRRVAGIAAAEREHTDEQAVRARAAEQEPCPIGG